MGGGREGGEDMRTEVGQGDGDEVRGERIRRKRKTERGK